MSYLKFDRNQLVNLKYSLGIEILRSNRAGAYAFSTLPFANTRKYHGLLVVPLWDLDGEWHVLLSALDETVIQHDREFHLALRKYPNTYHPQGHKYLRDFYTDPIPTHIYRVGGVILKKEVILVENEDRILFRYTLLDAHSPTFLRLQPFFAFRQRHKLSKANFDVIPKVEMIENGVKYRMYDTYPYLYLQASKPVDYTHAPDWYYNVEYEEERRRGYEYHEDLYSIGFFEFPIKIGETIGFSVGTEPVNPNVIKRKFTLEVKKRIPRTSYENNLENAAQQFFMNRGNKLYIIAGFPWFGVWARDTFISLPGLTIARGKPELAYKVLDVMKEHLRDGLFPNAGMDENSDVNSADAPMWFIWAIQQLAYHTQQWQKIWRKYWHAIRQILEAYRRGTHYNIHQDANGLIYQGVEGKALTWMDAIVDGKPVTPRRGYAVEINALWYNNVKFALELARRFDDKQFTGQWEGLPEQIKSSFLELFWDNSRKYLADYVNENERNFDVRPNQVIATSLPYTMLSLEQMRNVLEIIINQLLTPKGLRTLSPNHPDYKGIYQGDQRQRDLAYHQGTVWVWQLSHFVEGYLRVHQRSGLGLVERLYHNFEEEMSRGAIGTIPEIFDGDAPHHPRGAVSQAWSVSEVIRIKFIIDNFKKSLSN